MVAPSSRFHRPQSRERSRTPESGRCAGSPIGGAAGWHRVRVPDALIAAAASERGFGVLHYDQHFDRLATVLPFASQWVAPQGAIA